MRRALALMFASLALAACTSGTSTVTRPRPTPVSPLPLRQRVQIHQADELFYISMNVAQPPFDDIHVRKALEFAIDKQGMRKLRGGPIVGTIATHIFPDDLENNALSKYDPYRTPGDKGSLAKARTEMAKSKYDTNHDGVCDAAACKNVLTVSDYNDPYPRQTELIQQDLKPLGITLTRGSCEQTCFMYAKCLDPTQHPGLCPSVAWGKDYPDAITFALPMFSSDSIGPAGCCNYGLLGAAASLLRKDGYGVKHVPTVDPFIERCEALVGDRRVRCWTALDRFLMEKVAPVVPYLFANNVEVLGKRAQCYSFDQFAGLVALDHLCLTS